MRAYEGTVTQEYFDAVNEAKEDGNLSGQGMQPKSKEPYDYMLPILKICKPGRLRTTAEIPET